MTRPPVRAPRCALEIIRRWEGLRLTPYLCPAGYWTVGYGTVLRHTDGRMLTARDTAPTRVWTTAEAEAALQTDADRFAAAVARLCPRAARSDERLGALTSFTYNLGAGNLQASTLRRCVNAADDDEAARQFARWIFAGGRRLPGLVARRADEAALYRRAQPD